MRIFGVWFAEVAASISLEFVAGVPDPFGCFAWTLAGDPNLVSFADLARFLGVLNHCSTNLVAGFWTCLRLVPCISWDNLVMDGNVLLITSVCT